MEFGGATLTGLPQGAFTAYTPTVTQSGTVSTFVTNTSRYKQLGKLVIAQGRIQVNSAGTVAGANDVSISLPVTALDADLVYFGIGAIFDASASLIYSAQLRKASTTSFKFQTVRSGLAGLSTGGALNLGSIDFTAALATSDVLEFTIIYEAA